MTEPELDGRAAAPLGDHARDHLAPDGLFAMCNFYPGTSQPPWKP